MKVGKIILPLSFLLIIFSLGISTIFKQDNLISISERRNLETKPKINKDDIISGKYFKNLESYLLDQISFREKFRTIKSLNELYIYRKLDNHNIIIKDGYATSISYPLSDKKINLYIKKINYIINNYLKTRNVHIYHTLIPDKNYYLIKKSKYPLINYKQLENKLSDNIMASYIDIFNKLNINCYYKTDSHWKQDYLVPVSNKILESMHMKTIDRVKISNSLSPFYGVYYGQAALPMKPDEIRYIETKETMNATVYQINKRTKGFEKVKMYQEDKLKDRLTDSYDLFLGGANTITVIENDLPNSGKTLYIFSDSYGRSLTPLLISNYKKIVLYDIRYIKTSSALEMIPIEDNSDVLFAYSILSLNVSSNIQEV